MKNKTNGKMTAAEVAEAAEVAQFEREMQTRRGFGICEDCGKSAGKSAEDWIKHYQTCKSEWDLNIETLIAWKREPLHVRIAKGECTLYHHVSLSNIAGVL